MQFLSCLESCLQAGGGQLEPPLDAGRADKSDRANSVSSRARRIIPLLRRKKEVCVWGEGESLQCSVQFTGMLL